ncbi:MAG TPA: hypothetical protein VFE62_13170 [Gemmataceae bacterium]|nr:hypothetical protein [Gemmataceae bacterium]
MVKRVVLGLLFVLLPGAAWGQGVQEAYLPAKSQLYFRWDGMQTHRAAFDKTALGQMMKGDTGKFLDELWAYANENLKTAAQNEPKIAPMLKDFTKLIGTMHNNGVVFALEVDKVQPPTVQVVMVFPKAAGESGSVMPLIQKIAEETKADVKTAKVGKRFVNTINVEFLKVGWWAQGDDAVLYLGTNEPAAYAKAIDAKKTGIAGHPLYKKVLAFKEFPTASRGYFDIASTLNVLGELHPVAPKIVDELGLKGLKSVTFMSGFEGAGERSVTEIDMPSPRTGLLSLSSQKKISLKDLPALPDDITGFSASTLSVSKTYGVLVNSIHGIVKVIDADKADEVKDAIKAFEGAVGVDIDRDLFGQLGDVVVSYNSPSEGILGSGAVVAVQVKDGKKFASTLDKLIKGIPANPAGAVDLKKKAYRGGEIMQISISGQQLNRNLATIGIYKDWLIYAQYPQPVKGFIMRQEGVLPAWKADAALTKSLGQFPKEFNSIRVSDPRQTIKTVLAASPAVFDILNQLGSLAGQLPGVGFQYRPFDIDVIPHAQEATMQLFPNVTISTDDGKRIRTESRGSILLPF